MRAYHLSIIFIMGFISTSCVNQAQEPGFQDLANFIDTKKISSEVVIEEKKQVSVEKSKVEIVIQDDHWILLDNGFELRNYKIIQNGQYLDTAMVARFDPIIYGFELLQDIDDPKSVTQWAELANGIMVVNGGYFNEKNKSTGGLIIGDQKFGNLTTDGKNGYTGMILMRDGAMELLYLPEKKFVFTEKVKFGLQTYPTLIRPGGIKNIQENSNKRARRTIVARDVSGKILIITIPKPSMSLYDTMNFLQESELEIDFAMNLDGGPSAGAVIDYNDFHYEIPSWPIPNAIVIKKI